jgi:hypothetical protein
MATVPAVVDLLADFIPASNSAYRPLTGRALKAKTPLGEAGLSNSVGGRGFLGGERGDRLWTNIYWSPVSSVFRSRRIWFRGLRQNLGQRFAVCGSNPASPRQISRTTTARTMPTAAPRPAMASASSRVIFAPSSNSVASSLIKNRAGPDPAVHAQAARPCPLLQVDKMPRRPPDVSTLDVVPAGCGMVRPNRSAERRR